MAGEEQQESTLPRGRSDNTVRNIIIVLIVLVILGGVIYAYVVVKYPYIFAGGTNTTVYVNGTAMPMTEQQKINNSYKTLIFIALGGLVAIILYLLFKGKKAKPFKDPVPVDRAIMLFKQHYCLNNDIECIYDSHKGRMCYTPTRSTAIIVNDKLPYFHQATGDNFLLLEVEIREGLHQGLHTIIIPIDKGEDVIKTGYYRVDTHTPRFQFNLNKINFPMSSIQDKKDRMQMAMLEQIEEGAIPNSFRDAFYNQQTQQYPQSYIQTPLDQAEGFEGQPPNAYRPPARRYPSRRRYTYR
jgi:hypothetical protein